jgi:hypothetical protein
MNRDVQGGAPPAGQDSAGVQDSARTVKESVERALVREVIRDPEYAMAFTRVFNRDGDDFSRIFSRGGIQLEDVNVRELAEMDDAAFVRFSERLRRLQELNDADGNG